jgi:hypothetical protein
LQFLIHYQDPSVERLNYHLENEQQVVFHDNASIENIVRKEGVRQTKFTEWMEANKKYPTARELTYGDFPTKFVWHNTQKCEKKVKQSFQ